MSNTNSNKGKRAHHQLWITQELFVPVDEYGYCHTYSEGALGAVVQVRMSQSEECYALKIPRLLSDTLRENAYIEELMLSEYRNVKTIEPNSTSGLLGVQAFDQRLQKAVLSGRSLTGKGSNDDKEPPIHDEHTPYLIFVRFEKTRAPRFCAVWLDDGTVHCWPPKAARVTGAKTTKEKATATGQASDRPGSVSQIELSVKDIEILLKAGVSDAGAVCRLFGRVEYGYNASVNTAGTVIGDTLVKNVGIDGWYTMLPSVIYNWAQGSLQQSASKGVVRSWRLPQILGLGRRLLQGLNQIHGKGLLHADIRPANVMYQMDGADPERYHLIDYGSFGKDGQSIGTGMAADPDRHSLLGPSTMPQRASPFYAPERRESSEHESADAAVIYRHQQPLAPVPQDKRKKGKVPPPTASGGAAWFIIRLGWKLDLLDKDNEIRQEVREEIQRLAVEGVPSSNDSGLKKGDRIRIRDLVFEVAAVSPKNPQIIYCTEHHWKVFHDRLAVLADPKDIPPGFSSQSVPRVVELRKVSAATDVYGLGALLLYTAFSAGTAREEEEGSSAEAGGKVSGMSSALDTGFGALIRAMDNAQYVKMIWGMLDELCEQLQDQYRLPNTKRTKNLAEEPYRPRKSKRHPSSEALDESPSAGLKAPPKAGASAKQTLKERDSATTTLSERAEEITQLLVATTEGLQQVLGAFKYNSAHFCLFVHFVIGCIQRRDQLGTTAFDAANLIFSETRLDDPSDKGPAKRAFDRIELLIAWVQLDIDFGFDCSNLKQRTGEEVAQQLVREGDPIQRLRLIELQKALAEAKSSAKNSAESLQRVKEELSKAQRRIEELEGAEHVVKLVRKAGESARIGLTKGEIMGLLDTTP